jgi:hypothetical protein
MAVATIKFFKWLGIFCIIGLCLVTAVQLTNHITENVTEKLEILNQQKIWQAPSDGLKNYFPQMCNAFLQNAAVKAGNDLLGCYEVTDGERYLNGETAGGSRWLLWIGKADGNCVGLMINGTSSLEPPVEITCDFAFTVYEMLDRMTKNGDEPELYF